MNKNVKYINKYKNKINEININKIYEIKINIFNKYKY
jgi:hypothetical protein